MVFLKFIYLLIIALPLLISSPLSGQIIFKNLPQQELSTNDSLFLDISETRKILLLHGNWNVFSDKSEKVNVEVPSVFEGEANLVFEKIFWLRASDISDYKLKLNFLGLNYSADIFLNGISIYRHTGGEFPFALELPKDVLHADKSNILTLKLSNSSHPQNTIPVKQKFHFPQSLGGIFRDAYIHFTPNVFISNIASEIKFDAKKKKYLLTSQIKVENRESNSPTDTIANTNSFSLNINIRTPNGGGNYKSNEIKFTLGKNGYTVLIQNFELSSAEFWNPSNPASYLLTAELSRDGNLMDRTTRAKAFSAFDIVDNSITLNNQAFNIRGVTYYPVIDGYGGMIPYSQMEKDIQLIRNTGFNAVRFAKNIPHPYFLVLCQRYGLVPFIELPINSIPASILEKKEYSDRVINYLSYFIRGFKNYPIGGIGLGSSYSGDSEPDIKFIKNIAAIVKKNIDAITYASFADGDVRKIDNVDLIGIEIFNKPITFSGLDQLLLSNKINPGSIFISSAAYIANKGNSDGYLNKNSFEAQAKFFDDVINYSNSKALLGYFINSMFDYRSNYASIIAGYNEDNILPIGLADENRRTDRIGYKVVFAKLNNHERVTIPIGSPKDDSPMLFIITGIFIAIVMGVMINSGKKFREDSSRALLRPYNFFADVRDQRLISNLHTFIMLLIIAITSGLLLSNILFYFKENVRFEKVLLSFGSAGLMDKVSYLAWNPIAAIWWLSLLTILTFAFSILLVKAASFFVKTQVAFSSIFHAVIWSFLPLVILVPVGIILYRILSVEAVNIYLFTAMFIFTLWIFYRLMKGIYVIFDTNPANVYLYSILILVISAAGFVIYYQLSSSTFTYIFHALRNYNLLG